MEVRGCKGSAPQTRLRCGMGGSGSGSALDGGPVIGRRFPSHPSDVLGLLDELGDKS